MAEGVVVPREAELADTLTWLQLILAAGEPRLALFPPEPHRLLYEGSRPSQCSLQSLMSLPVMQKLRGHKAASALVKWSFRSR